MGRGLGLSVLALSAGLALLVSAASASSHGASKGGGELRLMWAEPDSLDPALANGIRGSWALLNATCAKLFRTESDPDTGKVRPVPEVAAGDPKLTNGGRTYTFDLKRTFRFDTGERVTAQSFKDAFDRFVNPKLKSRARDLGYLREIVGIEEAMKGTAETISGVRVLGRYRLQIRLTRRAGDFVARLTMPYFCPILPGTPHDKPIAATEVPASGPYRFVEHTPNRQVVLERNPNYRGERTAYADRIVWAVEVDPRVAVLATERGTNDWANVFALPTSAVRKLVDKYGVRRGGRFIQDSVTTVSSAFKFNTTQPAFKGAGQKPLKKAIVYALDRLALAGAHGYRESRASDRLLPAALRERLGAPPGRDLAAARKWYSRAKIRPTTLNLYMANFPWSNAVADVLESNLRPLGIDVEVESFDITTLFQRLQKSGEQWDLAWSAQITLYPDPAGALFPHVRGTRWEPRFDAVNRMTNAAARTKALAELEADLMRNDPPVAVWGDFTPLAFVSQKFGCWGADVRLDLAAVCKK